MPSGGEAPTIAVPEEATMSDDDRMREGGDEEADPFLLDDDEIDQVIAEFEQAEADAVAVLREALPASSRPGLPSGELAKTCERLRAELFSGQWPYDTIRRAAGFKKPLPVDDSELWLQSAASLVAPQEETGLGIEEESMLLSLEIADWVGAIVGLVRAGVGASAEPRDLVEYIDNCPEISGPPLELDDVSFIGASVEIVLPRWEALGAVDEDRRLTPLGAWGLPRALACAWNHDLDTDTR